MHVLAGADVESRPSGTQPFRVEYEYAANGEVASVFDASSAPRSSIWSQVSKNLAGQSTQEKFGTTELVDLAIYDGVAVPAERMISRRAP